MYDRVVIDTILDAGLVCHLGFVQDGQPFVIPTLYARIGDRVYVHGSAASRALRIITEPIDACLAVTLLDGIVLARSVFEHSVNYRSVVILGRARRTEGTREKLAALEAFAEKLVPGRWEEVRHPSPKELRATAILSVPIEEASAKVRTGPPDDGRGPDGALDVWAGVIPAEMRFLDPVADPALRSGIPVPPSVRRFVSGRRTR